MKRMYRLAGPMLATLLLAACSSAPWETINVPIDTQGWDLGYSKKVEGTGWIKEYVRPPETVSDWTQLTTLQFFDGVRTAPGTFMDGLESMLEKQCPHVDWNVLSSDKDRILYEWKIRDCPGHQDQHELSLILIGDYGLYRAAYTKRGSPMDPAVRKQWIAWLSEAKIIKAD